MRETIKNGLLILISTFSVGLGSVSAQTGGQGSEPTLNKYNNTINFPKLPKVEFSNLGTRTVVYSPDVKFVADEDIKITYDLTIDVNGKVAYVRPHSCDPAFNEYRKGGIHYLYASRFSAALAGEGDLHVTATFVFPGVEFPSEQIERSE